MDYAGFFRQSEQTIVRLHHRIHETLKGRGTPEGKEIWAQACAEFHARYDGLAFPGGYSNALQRIKDNDPEAIEAALVFLELRPYFFRSGYMRETLMRRLKHAILSEGQANRFLAVLEAQRLWRAKAQQSASPDVPPAAPRRPGRGHG